MIKNKYSKQNSFSNAIILLVKYFLKFQKSECSSNHLHVVFLFSYSFAWKWEEIEAPFVLTHWIPDFPVFSLSAFFRRAEFRLQP